MALRPLSTVPDLRLPPPAFDVRGWQVRTETDQKKVGKVDDMLLDQDEGLRFLEVNLGFLKKHVLVPAHRSHVDGTDEVVWIDDMTEERLEALPEYNGEPKHITPEYEQRLDAAYAGHAMGGPTTPSAVGGAAAAGSDETLPLTRLSDLDDYRVSDNDPRGWDVVTAEGQKVGDVKELLVDTASMRARYLVCDIDEKRLELEPLDRHILLPVSRVQLNPDKKRVLANALFTGDLATYPIYAGLPLTRAQDAAIERAFPTATEGRGAEPQRAGQHFFGTRMGNDTARASARTDSVRNERETARLSEPEGQALAAAPPRREGGVAREEALAEEERSRMLAREANAAERELRREPGEEHVIQAREGERTTIHRGEDEVNIEVQGDDIIIQRRPRD